MATQRTMRSLAATALVLAFASSFLTSNHFCHGLAASASRRDLLWNGIAATGSLIATTAPAAAVDVDVENFMKSGMVSQPMGVSGQAGKSKPETGVVLREGSEVRRDSRSGDVLAEILVKGNGGSSDLMPVVASFSSPWPLATGTVYDVECRDAQSGDGAFLAVSPDIGGQALSDVKDSFFVRTVLGPTGRFGFYGPPTDIKVKKSAMSADNQYKILDVSFSTLSQATQTEIPRLSRIKVMVPNGSKQAVMLVASASAARWKKGSDKAVASTVDSFQAIAAPQTGLKIRPKEKAGQL